MKTLDIIRWLMVSLAALIAVIFAAGWVNWYYPADFPETGGNVTKSDLQFIRSFDFSNPVGDAEKAMARADLRLWPIKVGSYAGDVVGFSIPLYVPIGIWCEDPWKTYRDRGSYEFPLDDLMFANTELQMVRMINKYSGVTIIERQFHDDTRDIFQRWDEGVELRPANHPLIGQFRDAYINYAAGYNQRILAGHLQQISEAWGYSLLCSPVINSTSSQDIISASLYGEPDQMRRSLLRREN